MKVAVISALTIALTAGAVATYHTPGDAPAPVAEETAPSTSVAAAQVVQDDSAPRPLRRAARHALRRAIEPSASTEVEDTLALLPPDTTMVAWTDDLEALMSELDIAGLARRYADELGDLEDALAQIGLTLMDLVEPASVGIDPTSPVAVAKIGTINSTDVLACRIADHERLRSILETFMASLERPFRVEMMGDAEVFLEDRRSPRLGILLRGEHLFLLLSSHGGDVNTAATQIAYQEPNESLPTTAAWRTISTGLTSGVARAFVNMPAILAQYQARLDRSLEAQRALFEGEREDDEWLPRHIARLEGQSSLGSALLGSIEAIGGHIDLNGSRLTGRVQVALREGSLIQQLVGTRSRHSALQRGLAHAPTFLLDGVLNPDALRRLAMVAGPAMGVDVAARLQQVKTFSGLPGDLFDIFSGELGIAVNAPGASTQTDASEDKHADDPHVTVTVGIADIDTAQRLVARLSVLAGLGAALEEDPDSDRMIIRPPNDRPIAFGFVEDTFVVTTDATVFDTLEEGGVALPRAAGRADVARHLGSSYTAGSLFFNPASLVGTHGHDTWEPSPERGSGSARSTAVAAKINRLRREQTALRKAHDRDIAASKDAMLALVGRVALSARMRGGALEIEGGLYHEAPTARELLATLVDHAVEQSRSERELEAQLTVINQPIMALYDRLNTID